MAVTSAENVRATGGVRGIRVRLIAVSQPIEGGDPRRLIVLAVKTSAGKVKEKGAEYYLKHYPDDKLGLWVIAAARGFPSVLEHVVMTFLIEGCSRVCTHQLVRHRIASYTQESQRYSAIEPSFVLPESIERAGLGEDYLGLLEEANRLYLKALESGVPYEDARYALPQGITSRLVMTVNLRELLHIACLRTAREAQWEIRYVVSRMVEEAGRVVPEIEEAVKVYCRGGDI